MPRHAHSLLCPENSATSSCSGARQSVTSKQKKSNADVPEQRTREATPTSWGTRGWRALDYEDGTRRRVDGMARGAGEPTAKPAKVDEADEEEEEDPLVRRKEELVVALKEARSREDARAERVARREMVSLCARLEAKNEKLLRRLPPELWQKILDENLHQNDLLALAMTCRFFREKQKDLGRRLVTNLNAKRLFDLRTSGKVVSHSLGWFQWVCDTLKARQGFLQTWSMRRVKGAVYKGDLLNYAAFQGSVEILRWLMEKKGCKLNGGTGWYAGMGGSVEVLEYLLGKGLKLKVETCQGAARGGHLEALKFLRGLDPPCPWDVYACNEAAERGHLDVLKFLRGLDPPCPWTAWSCTRAAEEGHLEVLKWLRDQDPPCPWHSYTCTGAAEFGHLEILKWSRSQDPPCPWHPYACSRAAKGGHLEILKWLRSQDPPCPWYRGECLEEARVSGHEHVVKWIDQQEGESALELSDSDSD